MTVMFPHPLLPLLLFGNIFNFFVCLFFSEGGQRTKPFELLMISY